MARQFSKLVLLIIALCLLVGCNTISFNPYKHMSDIVCCKSQQEFANMKEYVLAHSDESLHQQIIFERDGDVLDPDYQVTELNIWTETTKDEVHLLGEYKVASSPRPYYLLAYFTYKDDMLISYDYTVVETYAFSGEQM